jgi:hypothetical protein
MSDMPPNKITPANAGGALWFQVGRLWPGIAEFDRWAALNAVSKFSVY